MLAHLGCPPVLSHCVNVTVNVTAGGTGMRDQKAIGATHTRRMKAHADFANGDISHATYCAPCMTGDDTYTSADQVPEGHTPLLGEDEGICCNCGRHTDGSLVPGRVGAERWGTAAAVFTDKCECEHVDHFEGEGCCHEYGAEMDEDAMTYVATPYGGFRVCVACRREHLTDEVLA